jgi:hypothetical protein
MTLQFAIFNFQFAILRQLAVAMANVHIDSRGTSQFSRESSFRKIEN